MCQHLKGAPPDRYAFANVHTALVSEQVTATLCLSCANVTFPLHTELVLTQAQSQSSAVSGQALIPSLAPSTDQKGRRQRSRAAVYSWLHNTSLAIFKILETVLLFQRKALPGPLVVLRIPSYSETGAHPLWEVAKPSMSVHRASCPFIHTQVTFLPPLSPPTGEKCFKSLGSSHTTEIIF